MKIIDFLLKEQNKFHNEELIHIRILDSDWCALKMSIINIDGYSSHLTK